MPDWNNGSIAALVGALSGAVTSYVVSKVDSKRARIDRCCEALHEALEEFQEEACTYWRGEGQNPSAERKIKAILDRLDMKLCKLKKTAMNRKAVEAMEHLVDQLFEVATGGDFETLKRRRDVAKVGQIKSLCSDFQSYLH